MDKRLVLITLK